MDRGSVGILNVGTGDTKLSFDPKNLAERIRAARIVADMLRRGYALLVEIDDGKGGKVFSRATAFREDVCEYVIADFDPIEAQKHDAAEEAIDHEEALTPKSSTGGTGGTEGEPAPGKAKSRRGLPASRSVRAANTRAIAVAPTAGG